MTIVNSEIPAPKKKGGKIVLIETQPEADWFVPVTTKRERKVWCLRFRMSGWNPRLFGPFKSKQHCLLFLDDAIGSIQDAKHVMRDKADMRIIDEPCAKVWLQLSSIRCVGNGNRYYEPVEPDSRSAMKKEPCIPSRNSTKSEFQLASGQDLCCKAELYYSQ
jgi:hypothetical protein